MGTRAQLSGFCLTVQFMAWATCQTPASPELDYPDEARRQMVQLQLAGRQIFDDKVLEVMGRIPRHRFVPEQLAKQAYNDQALQIGFGQTISQPYVVALMTQALSVEAGDKILEIGTGSGYQAVVLAEMGARVFSIEILPELAARTKKLLQDLDYHQIQLRTGDGYLGWPEEAPFDAIIVTAAPENVPPALIDQLKDGGRLVIPVGRQDRVQQLRLYEKQGEELKLRNLGAVRFVPLTGDH